MKSRTCISVYPKIVKDEECFVIKISRKENNIWKTMKIIDINKDLDIKVFNSNEEEQDM